MLRAGEIVQGFRHLFKMQLIPVWTLAPPMFTWAPYMLPWAPSAVISKHRVKSKLSTEHNHVWPQSKTEQYFKEKHQHIEEVYVYGYLFFFFFEPPCAQGLYLALYSGIIPGIAGALKMVQEIEIELVGYKASDYLLYYLCDLVYFFYQYIIFSL